MSHPAVLPCTNIHMLSKVSLFLWSELLQSKGCKDAIVKEMFVLSWEAVKVSPLCYEGGTTCCSRNCHDQKQVGHALENDLEKLRIVHDRIIDTGNLYPHPRACRASCVLNDSVEPLTILCCLLPALRVTQSYLGRCSVVASVLASSVGLCRSDGVDRSSEVRRGHHTSMASSS